MARLAAAAGVTVAGLLAALLLHDHQFAVVGHMRVNGVLRSYREPTLPLWRDPLVLVCAFGAAAAAAALLTRRLRRVGLAFAVAGSAFAGAVYVHQQAVHTFFCPPGVLCPLIPSQPGLWSHPASLWIMAAGVATALLLVLPRRWLRIHRLRLRHG